MRRSLILLAALLGMGATNLQPAVAASGNTLEKSASLSYSGARQAAPMAFLEFCLRYSAHCQRRGSKSAARSGAMKVTGGQLSDLVTVNRAVNASIRPVADTTLYGVKDRWRVGVAKGDCEDYVLEKRRRLIAHGWPSSAVLIALGRARGQQHAVLIARTSEGDYVLDNLTNQVLPVRRSSVSLSQVQSPDNPKIWQSF